MNPQIRLLFILLAFTSSFALPNASAIILYGEDNDANQTDPATGAPWGNVAGLSDVNGTNFNAGTAVYLGDRYMLTANHVDRNAGKTHVTFNGVDTYAIDQESHQQVADGLDLKVFRLTEDPGLPGLLLYEDALASGDLAAASTLVGWGVGREEGISPGTNVVDWGASDTIEKRWGTNTTLLTSGTASYEAFGETYNYESLNTRLENNEGADEAAMTLYDSGGALFQEIGGNWYLSGIATTVEGEGSSTFGLITGDLNSFVRIAAYDEEINAVIPEPATWTALTGIGAILLAVGLRRKR